MPFSLSRIFQKRTKMEPQYCIVTQSKKTNYFLLSGGEHSDGMRMWKCSSWNECVLPVANTAAGARQSLYRHLGSVWNRNENSVHVYVAGWEMHSAKHSAHLLSSLYVWDPELRSEDTAIKLWFLPLKLLQTRESRT